MTNNTNKPEQDLHALLCGEHVCRAVNHPRVQPEPTIKLLTIDHDLRPEDVSYKVNELVEAVNALQVSPESATRIESDELRASIEMIVVYRDNTPESNEPTELEFYLGEYAKPVIDEIMALIAAHDKELQEENKMLRKVIKFYLGDDYMAEHPDPREWRAEANRRSAEDSEEDRLAMELHDKELVAKLRPEGLYRYESNPKPRATATGGLTNVTADTYRIGGYKDALADFDKNVRELGL